MNTNLVHAAEYYLDPFYSMRVRMDDNRRLSSDEHNSTGGMINTAKVDVGVNTEKLNLKLSPKINVTRYTENIGLDVEEYFVDLKLDYAIHEKHYISINAEIAEQSVGVSEINSELVTFNEVNKSTKSISPTYVYQYDEKNSLQLSYSLIDVSYDDTSAGFSNYEYQVVRVSYTHNLTEKDSLTALYYHSIFDVPGSNAVTNSDAAQLSYTHQFNSTLSGSAGYGKIYSTSDFDILTNTGLVNSSSSVSGELITASIDKSFEKTDLSLSFSRDVSPGVRGNQNISDLYEFGLTRKLSEKWSSNFLLRFLDNQSQSQFINSNDVYESISFFTGLNYRLSKNISMSLDYNHQRIERERNNSLVKNNSVYLNLSYSFDKFSFSR
jgi:hypothetical protein